MVAELEGGFTIIAEKHMGSAGPPSADETMLLRNMINDLELD